MFETLISVGAQRRSGFNRARSRPRTGPTFASREFESRPLRSKKKSPGVAAGAFVCAVARLDVVAVCLRLNQAQACGFHAVAVSIAVLQNARLQIHAGSESGLRHTLRFCERRFQLR